MSKCLSFLSIEPDADIARRLERCLTQLTVYRSTVHRLADPAVALRRLARHDADVLIVANAMPAVTGREVIQAARVAGEARPIIATADDETGYLAADLISAGADAYLNKRDMTPAFVQRVIRRALVGGRQRAAQVWLRKDALSGVLKGPRRIARGY